MASGTSSDSDFESVEMSTTPTVSIDPDFVTTSSLHALQSADHRLLNEQAGLFSLLIRLSEQADEQAKPSHTIC
jgi:hypothetical protein